MRLYRPPRNDEEIIVLCGSHRKGENEKTRVVWEDVTSDSMSHHHFENIKIEIYHFCWYLVIYKSVLLQTKTILSRLNLISFKYHMVIFIRRDSPQDSHIDLRVVFASSDVFRETKNSELELSTVKSLRKLGFEQISDREGTYVYQGQALEVLVKPSGQSKLGPEGKGSKEIAVDKTWWSDGKDFQFTLYCEEGSSFVSGSVEVQGGDVLIEENFKADDWYRYLKEKFKLNQVANLIPLARKLELSPDQLRLLIDEWRTDKEQLLKILYFRADNNPDETMPRLKAVLENIDLAGDQRVSKRGEMHIVNLREFKEDVDGVNDERCSKAESINERGKCLIPSFLQDCCIQTMTNADTVASCEPTQCLVSLTGKGYLASEVFEKLKQCFSESSYSDFQSFSKFIPSLVQMTKEVFRQVEDNPKLDGMWGLFNKDVEKASNAVKMPVECTRITSLMGIMVDLLGKICHKNKSLMSAKEKDIKDTVKWCDLRSLLHLTEKFMRDGESLKLKMRLEVKGKRTLSIMTEEDIGMYLVRDYKDLAFGLIEFARFHASHIVSFSALVNETKLIPLDGVNYDEEEDIFVQSFKIMTTQEPQSVVCLADVNDKGCYKTVGSLRSEIVPKDIEKVRKDFQTGNPSVRLVFHELNHERMLVHGTSQNKMDEVMQRLRQTFDCSVTAVFKSPKLKLLSFSDQPCFDLIYHYGDEGIYYQGDGMAIVYEEIPSGSEVKSPLCKESLGDIPSLESVSLVTEHTSACKENEVKSLLCKEIISDTSSSESSSLVPQCTSTCDHKAESIVPNSEIVCAVTSALEKKGRSANSQPFVLVVQDNRQMTTKTVNNQQTYQNEIYGTAAIGDQASINSAESQDDSTLREKSKHKEDSA